MPDILSLIRPLNLSGGVIGPDDSQYGNLRRVWNGFADRHPAVIVRVASSADVAKVVRVAAETGTQLAIRGGGHSLPGLSTCDGGIVLDLGEMNEIRIDPQARRAVVGGGALLGDLDRASAPHGLVVPAGVISHTGAAGLTLGGGMGWLSRRFGMTVDHLEQAEIVVASGDTLIASANSEPELFWGLRGGGGNFGVVTQFTYRMQRLGEFRAVNWTYDAAKTSSVLAGLDRLASMAPRHLTASFSVQKGLIAVSVVQSGPDTNSAVEADYGKLANHGQASPPGTDFVAHQSRHDDLLPWGRRYYARGGFFGELTGSIIDAISEVASRFPTPDSEIYCMQLGGAVSDVHEDATAYSGRSACWYWIVQPVWDDPRDDARCLAFGRESATQLAGLSMSRNYVNEQAEAGNEIARQAYGSDKYRRLERLKARFDPENVFRLNQNILPRA